MGLFGFIYVSTTLIVPVGSYEQHGAHLPLNTDTQIAVTLATRLSETLANSHLGPPITISASGEHQGFVGTLSIGNEVLHATVLEIARSADWAQRIVFVNGHGGNNTALFGAIQHINSEGRMAMCWSPYIDGADSHAGHTETSLMLAINPGSVDMAKAVIGTTIPLCDVFNDLRTGGLKTVSPNGVLGDPTTATAESGRVILLKLLDDLVRSVNNWLS